MKLLKVQVKNSVYNTLISTKEKSIRINGIFSFFYLRNSDIQQTNQSGYLREGWKNVIV
jgi:hypothetical protein